MGRPVYNFADGDDRAASSSPRVVTDRLDRTLCPSPPGPQTAGTRFTEHTARFLQRRFPHRSSLPGEIFLETRPSLSVIAGFDQYEHLDELDRIAGQNPEIAAVLGKDYVITPDIVIGRQPFSDAAINASATVCRGHTRQREDADSIGERRVGRR